MLAGLPGVPRTNEGVVGKPDAAGHAAVGLLEGRLDPVQREVVEAAVVPHVLHVPGAVGG